MPARSASAFTDNLQDIRPSMGGEKSLKSVMLGYSASTHLGWSSKVMCSGGVFWIFLCGGFF